MNKIGIQNKKILIVDDSAMARLLLRMTLSSDPAITIIGEASNGKQAVELVAALQPDLVTMDIEMPVMNGLQAIEEIMRKHPVPVLVLTSHAGASVDFAALARGALEVMPKPDFSDADQRLLLNKIKLLAGVKLMPRLPLAHKKMPDVSSVNNMVRHKNGPWNIVAIASSMGGPAALDDILSQIPADFPFPIVVAQHISDGFAQGLSDWLNSHSPLEICVGCSGMRPLPGKVMLSPAEFNMQFTPDGTVELADREARHIYHPSCDQLLSSVAQVFGSRSIGIILTGMGHDGVTGMQQIKQAGGFTMAQDQKSSAVFGMPKLAIESGCVDRILPVDKMAGELVRLIHHQ